MPPSTDASVGLGVLPSCSEPVRSGRSCPSSHGLWGGKRRWRRAGSGLLGVWNYPLPLPHHSGSGKDDHAHTTRPQLWPSGGRCALRVPGGGCASHPLRARGLPCGHLPETKEVQRAGPAAWCCVQMSCHPELNQYIQDTLHCVKPLLEKNDVEKVVVVILDKEHRPVEKFVFEITQPPLLSISSDSLLSHVEQLLRAFILKISVCDAVLDHNPPGCTFTVLVHTREAATRNMEKIQVIKDFPWILADEQDVHMHDPRLIPLKTMTSDILKMQLYVEERAHKGS
ncbi:mitotic spindle assembly checkpoint protein MAD2B isoform X1 [Theropithecus gelada]|uniref:mitotic spindle assembly checkpoint protein MAD2B isoform X1 n=1 Tax=Theropithecus gelada TaxID=9565 RepID=UPI000DC1B223|nr:mitotic spindle assembly checkpoint protein MAD2B isoform X1 [Theropithecus gelada]